VSSFGIVEKEVGYIHYAFVATAETITYISSLSNGCEMRSNFDRKVFSFVPQ
jgi:hypothetical protein